MAYNGEASADGPSSSTPTSAPSTCPTNPDLLVPCRCCLSGCSQTMTLCPKCCAEHLKDGGGSPSVLKQKIDSSADQPAGASPLGTDKPDMVDTSDLHTVLKGNRPPSRRARGTQPSDSCTPLKTSSCMVDFNLQSPEPDFEERFPSPLTLPPLQSESQGGLLLSTPQPQPRAVKRCATCRKRLGLLGFKCRCGDQFCALHRYSDKHDCSFDYRAAGRLVIAKENPVVKASKIVRI